MRMGTMDKLRDGRGVVNRLVSSCGGGLGKPGRAGFAVVSVGYR